MLGFRVRQVVSISFLVLWVIVVISGLPLFLGPKGVGSGEVLIWGLSKNDWRFIHTYCGFAAVAVSVIHIALNWRCLINYFKRTLK